MLTEQQANIRLRAFLTFFALIIGATSAALLFRGTFTYRNYWGGVIFVPVALVVSLLFLVGALRIGRTAQPSRKQRVSRKQRRKEAEALNTRFPIEDFEKPWSG